MAYPDGVSTATCTAGSSIGMVGGEPSRVSVVVRAVLGGNGTHLVWAATGQPLVPLEETYSAEPGMMVSFLVPHVDQAGIVDSSGNAATMWAYYAQITVTAANGQTKTWVKTFQPLVGDSQPIDLDLIPDGSITSPVSAPIPAVLSVDGNTGHVTTADAVEAYLDEHPISGLPSGGTDGQMLGLEDGEAAWLNVPPGLTGGAIHDADSKATPVDADELPISDSADSNDLKRITVGDLKTLVAAAVVDGAPGTLDTLNELAAALGDDANFATTVTNALADKAADNAVVKLAGNQEIDGVKQFLDAPVVPDDSFAQTKVIDLEDDLATAAQSSEWGAVAGTLSAQTDLQALLDDKADADTALLSASGLTGVWHGTQAAYEAITPKDPNVLYFVMSGEPEDPPEVLAPVRIASFASTGNVTTSGAISLDSAATAAIGEVVQVAVACGGSLGDSDVAVADSNGHTWSLIDAQSVGGSATTVFVFQAVVSTALDDTDTITVTRTPTGGMTWGAHKVPGASGTVSEVQANSSSTGVTSASTASIGAADRTLVLMAVAFSVASTSPTPVSGYTALAPLVCSGAGNPRQLAVIYRQVATATATTPQLSWTSNSAYAAVAIEMAPAA